MARTNRGCKEFYISPGAGGSHASVKGSSCVSSEGKTVYASIVFQKQNPVRSDPQFNWSMTLQTKEFNEWRNIGAASGYVNPKSPSHRTFKNIQARAEKPVRVKFEFKSPVNNSWYSKQWIHRP